MTMRGLCATCLTSLMCFGLIGCSERESGEFTGTSVPSGSFSTTNPFPTARISYTSSACNLETINSSPFASTPTTVAKLAPVDVVGWAYDEGAKQLARSRHVVLLDSTNRARYFASGLEPRKRPDVGTYVGLPGLVDAGFESSLSFASVDAGTYRMLVGIEGTSSVAFCDVGRLIVVE
jgi:hypothetical protein